MHIFHECHTFYFIILKENNHKAQLKQLQFGLHPCFPTCGWFDAEMQKYCGQEALRVSDTGNYEGARNAGCTVIAEPRG